MQKTKGEKIDYCCEPHFAIKISFDFLMRLFCFQWEAEWEVDCYLYNHNIIKVIIAESKHDVS